MIGYAEAGSDGGSRQSFKVPQKLSDLRIRISNNSSSGSIQLCPLFPTYIHIQPSTPQITLTCLLKKYRPGKTLKSL